MSENDVFEEYVENVSVVICEMFDGFFEYVEMWV